MNGIGRRGFLAGAAALAGGATVVACAAPDRESQIQSFVNIPEQRLPGQSLWFATASAHGLGGNSVVVRTVDGRAKKVEGNPGFPINRGKIDARGQAGVQSLYHPDRLQTPLRRRGLRGGGDFDEIGWAEALDLLTEKLGAAADFLMITGPLSGTRARIARDVTAGLNGRHMVYEASETTVLRAALKLALGADAIPYFDLAEARSVLSFGADMLGTWVSPVHYGVGYGEMRQGDGRPRGRLIQVEPHMSLTGANADRWVYVKPGQEGALALSIAQVIAAEGLTGDDRWFDVINTVGGLDALNAYAPDQVTGRTGVPVETIQAIAREFAAAQPGFAIVGGPALAQSNGLDAGVAVLLLNWMVGSVGAVGGVRPNPAPPEAIPAPTPPTPFGEWAALADGLRAGEGPDAAFVYDTNPVYGLPPALKFDEALGRIPFVVGMGTFLNETIAHADLVLPATHPFEEWGDFIPEPAAGMSVIGYQQPVITPWTKSRSFGDVLLTLSEELLGEAAPPWTSMREAVRSTATEVFGADDMERKWIELLRDGGSWTHGSTPGRFAGAPDWHINLLAEPAFAGDALKYPLHLVPFESVGIGAGDESVNIWLQATPDPLTTVTWQTWVELNPATARDLGVKRGDIVAVQTSEGEIEAAVYESPVVPPNVVGVPVGRGHTVGGRWREDRGVNVLGVLAPQIVAGADGHAWAATRARVRKTGDFRRLPTLEVIEQPRNDGAEPVVQVTRE